MPSEEIESMAIDQEGTSVTLTIVYDTAAAALTDRLALIYGA